MAVKNYTSIDLASNALLLIGEETISSFTDDSTAALIAANLYELTYESLLTLHPWRFASTKSTLSRLTASPVNEWTYGDKLFTNNTSVVLDYTFKPDESFLPAYFAELLEYRLAAVFAIPITESTTKGDYYSTLGERQLAKAKTIDSQMTPSSAPAGNSSLINFRG